MHKIRFTKEGFAKLQQEYDKLLKERPAVVEDLKKAREMGDLKENGYYKASRQKLSYIDGRLFRLKNELKLAEIIENDPTQGISIGSTVTLFDGQKERILTIVGDLEADPSDGKISLLSPLGKILEGKKINEKIALETPRGQIIYNIVKLK